MRRRSTPAGARIGAGSSLRVALSFIYNHDRGAIVQPVGAFHDRSISRRNTQSMATRSPSPGPTATGRTLTVRSGCAR